MRMLFIKLSFDASCGQCSWQWSPIWERADLSNCIQPTAKTVPQKNGLTSQWNVKIRQDSVQTLHSGRQRDPRRRRWVVLKRSLEDKALLHFEIWMTWPLLWVWLGTLAIAISVWSGHHRDDHQWKEDEIFGGLHLLFKLVTTATMANDGQG